VADVFFGQFVVRQVDGRELVFVELGGDLAAFAFAVCAQASFFRPYPLVRLKAQGQILCWHCSRRPRMLDCELKGLFL
jgi:hypothetical protein